MLIVFRKTLNLVTLFFEFSVITLRKLVVLPAVFLCASSYVCATERPNVVVVVTDDQGWADIGYNNSNVYTPNLDKLARGSAVLTQHYVMPQCTPTRLALLTGQYPGRFGTTGLQATNSPVLPKNTLTMASFLQSQGYDTHLVGKWHLGSWPEHGPNHHGFKTSYGALAGAVGAYDHRYKVDDHPNGVTWHRDHEIIPGFENGQHVTDLVTAEAINVIRQERSRPFFLYLAHFAPHTPLDERGKFVDTPTQLDPENPNRWLNEDDIPWFNDPKGVIQKEQDPERRLFLAALYHLDDAIGQVISELDDRGLRENTIIFFTSDNGPQVSWHGGAYPDDLQLTDFNQPIPFRGSKTQVYEGGMLVPGLVNWKGKIAPKELESVLHVVDWMPTIASMIGAPLEADKSARSLDGFDFSAQLLGEEYIDHEREIYATHRTLTDKWSLRKGDWKIVSYGRQEPSLDDWELFRLTTDPRETLDLSKQYPDKLSELHQRFKIQREKDSGLANIKNF